MKKIDRFTEIKNLIHSISRAELETVLLQFKSQVHVSYSENSIALISSITNNPNISETDALSKFETSAFKKEGLGSFFMYVRNSILDSLLLDVNIERPGVYNNQFRNKVSNTKKILQVQILLSKGLFKEALKILDEVRSKATKYEHFECLYESNYLRAISNSHQTGLRSFSKSLLEISLSKKQKTSSNKSKMIYLNALVQTDNLDAEKIPALAEAIQKLETIQESQPSANNAFHILSIKAMKETQSGKFESAKKRLEQAIELVRKTPALHSMEREADLLLDLSSTQTQLNQFEESRKTLELTSQLVKKSSFEFYIISKRLIYLDFYTNRISDLRQKINHNIKSKYFRRLPFAASQLEFFKAVSLFLSNDAKSCCKILLEEIRIEQDVSTDLQLGQTLFLFMSATELDEEFKTLKHSAKIEIKKAIVKLEKDVGRKRDRLILKIFKKLSIDNVRLHETLQNMQSTLDQLNNTDQESKWKPFTFEIFPLQLWLNSKSKSEILPLGSSPISEAQVKF